MAVPILKVTAEEVKAAGIPATLPAGGLSQARQDYLHKEIRPFIAVEHQDTLCPAPAASSQLSP